MRKRPLFVILALTLALGLTACKNDGGGSNGGDGWELDGWELVFHDEFDGDSLNPDYWTCQTGTGSDYGLVDWGNSEAQYYRQENVSLSDGVLKITAKRESFGGKNYTSARLRTAGKFATCMGRIEARISLPEVTGMWPAFWMLPENSPYGGWPFSGEIDIMEARGRETTLSSGALHYGGPSDIYKTSTHRLKNSTVGDYHVYALEWTEFGMTWFVDDDDFLTVRSDDWFTMSDEDNDLAPFDTEFHILLNLAVGGHFDGFREPPADFTSAEMKVDYVRVYREKV